MESKIIEFQCLDTYEAEKLTSIFSKQKDGSIFVVEIVKRIDSELVLRLKDGSHHSILLLNPEEAGRLDSFFRKLTENKLSITQTEYEDDRTIFHLN